LLVSVFTSLGCMHGEGLGIAGIMQRHEEYSLPKGQTPVFWDGISRFRVVLPNLNWRKTTTDRVNRVRADLMKKMLAQSELDQEKGAWVGMLWDRWGRGEYFSAAETAEMLDISVPTARGLLKDLEQAGLIESCSGYVRGAYRFL
ncbi:MAG: hypothetical protein Q4F72_12785, partial [Desulfovibrionaceae bacterium]|nr:hypothetical protein [Desulfovibrionaceae bacterium]